MAKDFLNTSCSSSLGDSGFESITNHLSPKPPPRKKRVKKENLKNTERKWSAVFSYSMNKISNLIEKVVVMLFS